MASFLGIYILAKETEIKSVKEIYNIVFSIDKLYETNSREKKQPIFDRQEKLLLLLNRQTSGQGLKKLIVRSAKMCERRGFSAEERRKAKVLMQERSERPVWLEQREGSGAVGQRLERWAREQILQVSQTIGKAVIFLLSWVVSHWRVVISGEQYINIQF